MRKKYIYMHTQEDLKTYWVLIVTALHNDMNASI